MKNLMNELRKMPEAQLSKLASKACATVLVVGLTAFSLVGGGLFYEFDGIGGGDAKTQQYALADLEVGTIFDFDSAAAAFDKESAKVIKIAGNDDGETNINEVGYLSAYASFYDASAINPDEVSAIAINGQKIVYMPNGTDAQAVLDGIIARYTEGNSRITSVNFAEDVQIVIADDYVTAEMAAKDKTISETYLCHVEEAIQYIINGTSTPITYTVQSGDTMWDIAIRNGLSPYQLAEMNPQVNCDRLSIGDTLYLYEKKPFVNVTTTEVATETESIPFTTQTTQTADLYKGQTRVVSAGVNGSREKQVEYIKQNGVIVSSSVLSETVISEPVTQYAETGTTAMPIKTGSGALISPVGSTQLSSSAGAYHAGRGGRRHAGVDLKASSGDPICASDAGTVVFSGYSGSYGNIVKISHGNGIETRYAHCAKLLVSVGDNVEKGQQIATVGKTGNATGYLVHFEVLVNGSTVNPLNYI